MFESLEAFGDRPCIITETHERVSYVDFARLVDDFSKALGHRRKLVLLEARNSLSSIVAMVACCRSRHPLILCSDTSRSRIESKFDPDVIVDASGQMNAFRQSSAHRLHPDLSLMLSTSGSTGSTKLVRLAESAIVSNAAAIVSFLGIGSNDRAITTLPPFFSYGLSVIVSHLAAGASLVLTDRSVIDDKFWEHFDQHTVTSIAGVPYTYELLESRQFRQKSVPSLRCMTTSGGRMDPSIVRRYARWAQARGVRFFLMYGQTETVARMAYLPPELALRHPDCIGQAIPGGNFRILDSSGRRAAKKTTGELVYTGRNIMMGYANDPLDLGRGPELTELRTGDLAQEVKAGLFKIVGRSSRFSKIVGLRIDLDEMETLLHKRGHQAYVAGNDELIAVAIIGGVASLAAAQVVIDERTRIPSRACIVFELLEAPRLPSGKVDYPKILKKALELHHARASLQAAHSAHGSPLATAFARAVRRDNVESQDSFISLGGDSLSYVELSLAIEREVGYLPTGWERLTVQQIELLTVTQAPRAASASASLSTEVVLRAIAPVLIVAHHTLMTDLGGGLELLLLLLGINLGRFQAERLASTARSRIFRELGGRLLLPYYMILGCYALQRPDHVPWQTWVLLGNFGGLRGTLAIYWFVSAYVQILLIVAALMSVARIRRLVLEKSGTFAAGFLIAALIVKVAVFSIFHHIALLGRTPDQFLYIVAMGWCLHEARTVTQRAILIAIAAAIAVIDLSGAVAGWWSGFDGHWRGISLFSGVLVLACMRAVRVPRPARHILTAVATASLTIYLAHPILLASISGSFGPVRTQDPLCYATIICIVVAGTVAHRGIQLVRRRRLQFREPFRAPLRLLGIAKSAE